jgi:hypothetical protein
VRVEVRRYEGTLHSLLTIALDGLHLSSKLATFGTTECFFIYDILQ